MDYSIRKTYFRIVCLGKFQSLNHKAFLQKNCTFSLFKNLLHFDLTLCKYLISSKFSPFLIGQLTKWANALKESVLFLPTRPLADEVVIIFTWSVCPSILKTLYSTKLKVGQLTRYMGAGWVTKFERYVQDIFNCFWYGHHPPGSVKQVVIILIFLRMGSLISKDFLNHNFSEVIPQKKTNMNTSLSSLVTHQAK